jgi:hypothetical protein
VVGDESAEKWAKYRNGPLTPASWKAMSVTSEFADIASGEQWPVMTDWLLDQNARFKRAIRSIGGWDL